MNDTSFQRFLGGSPGTVLLKLALLSLLVGVLLAAFGFSPLGFVRFLRELFHDLFGFGMDAVHRIIGYVLAGAVIVVPLWLLMRLLSSRK